MERRPTLASNRTVVDAKTSLALWLRAGRAQKGMTLDDVARVTKIQPRILERLEAGKLDGLPAEVFVRGFIRSVARCLGLDEGEALRRYAACGGIAPSARALVEAMADLAPSSATAARATPRKMVAVEVIDLAPALAPAGEIEARPTGAAAAAAVADEPGPIAEGEGVPAGAAEPLEHAAASALPCDA